MKGRFVSKIPQLYKGCHCIVAAPGPSLTPDVVEVLEEVKDRYAIFAVGDAYKVLPFLDELYACDNKWWDVHGEKVLETIEPKRLWGYQQNCLKYGANRIEGCPNPGFSLDPARVHFGSNSGYQALNLAYLWGCTKFILVGFNMQRVNNETHFFKDRHHRLKTDSPYGSFVQKFNTIQRDIRDRVINCTPNSALTAFKKADLRETVCE